MSNILSFPERQQIKEEAGYWLVRLDAGELDDDESEALREWLHRDPDHRTVLLEMASLWDDMDVLAQLSELFPLTRTRHCRSRWPRLFGESPLLPVAAAAAGLVLVVGLLSIDRNGVLDVDITGQAAEETVYRTSIGERTEITLPDGSVTTLNTNSLVEVEYGDRQRDVWLLKGEAHFRVAKDNNRPFVVHAGNGTVRAIGTAFNVRLKDQGVEVTVSEGRVEIASASKPDELRFFGSGSVEPARYLTTLEAGQQAVYGDRSIHSVQTIGRESLSRDLSWQHGMLVFKGETLDEVVREISRYTQTEIVISNPEIRNIRLGGYFKTGEVESLLTVLKANFPIKVDRINDNLIYLSRENVARAEN